MFLPSAQTEKYAYCPTGSRGTIRATAIGLGLCFWVPWSLFGDLGAFSRILQTVIYFVRFALLPYS
ncbi:MAG: hypothetical protein WCA07_06645 [Gloeobacterales cyanobacterium]